MKNTQLDILDDVDKIRSFDPDNMYNRIFDFPEQMEEALTLAYDWSLTAEDFADAKNIVIIGMGGSAIGGDLVRSYLSSKLLIPYEICRNYRLPEYVDDETLVIVSSYSGNTEETLSALDDALQRKAMIAAISTGGLLEDVAELNYMPLLKLPGGLQPRAALGFSFVPILVFFERVGLVKGVKKEIEVAIKRMKDLREKYIEGTPSLSNPAKRMAQRMHKKIPVIYGGPDWTGVVALRWKGQICENGKNMAFVNVFPEACHNELVGWSAPVKEHAEHLMVVMLRDMADHPKIRKRMNIVKDIIEKHEIEVVDVHSMGDEPLERMFSLIQLGDFMSYYLAIINEVDPTPVELIESLKKALAD
ncbi:MAG: bifunctional phosphoglucose/phosphomannose isomerase [Candidatus Zixiibacteriota bacterium]